jgi:formylmethanofuran dehydrogenase subunit B
MMTEEVKQEIKNEIVTELSGIIGKAVADSFEKAHGLNCRCGVGLEQHKRDHDRIEEFFNMIGDLSKTARSTLVKILVYAVIGLIGTGLAVKCGWLRLE